MNNIIDLNSVSSQLDNNLTHKQKNNLSSINSNSNNSSSQSFRIFTSKNNPNEDDQKLVNTYSSIIKNCKKGFNTVGCFLSNLTSQPTKQSIKQPILPVNRPLKPIPKLRSNNQVNSTQVNRCQKCTCILKISSGCTYCKSESPKEEIKIIDSDQEEKDKLLANSTVPNNRMTSQTTIQNVHIPTSSFYEKKENLNQSRLSSSSSSRNLSNISLTEDKDEDLVKYEIDYLYVGTYRFISRTYIRFKNDRVVLFINQIKEGLQIDYKWIVKLFHCEKRIDNSKHTYLKIDFCKQAIEAINAYICKLPDLNGSFKCDTINGHEKYFIMKLKFLKSDDALNLKKRLKMYLPTSFKDEPEVYNIFEEQRNYCLNMKTRNHCSKKQKTFDNRSKNQDKSKINEIENVINDEPMQIDNPYNCISSSTTLSYESSKYDRLFPKNPNLSSKLNNSIRPSMYSSRLLTFGSSNSIKYVDQDEDMEVSEIKSKSNLSVNDIKSNKILYETKSGETLVIGKGDLDCLYEGNFLNDKIIEFYLMYIKSNLIEKSISSKTYIFSTFFFTKMLKITKDSLSDGEFYENLYNSVKNWTKNVDIFDYDFLIIPIFRNYHWSLALIVYPSKVLKDDFEVILDDDDVKPAIIFMDSMGRNKLFGKFSKYLRNFLRKECLSKKGREFTFDDKEMLFLDPEVPCQLNGYDCGIFVLSYVEKFLQNPQLIIEKIRKSPKTELENWFGSNSLRGKRKEIFTILYRIHQDNLKNNLRFDSDEDLTLKSDEEIEIITNDNNKDLFSDDEDMC